MWHVDEGRTLFAGPLRQNAMHQHGAPVFLAGLYQKFGLRLPGGSWQTCRTAMIPAGVLHELDIGNNPIAVLYVEPHIAGADALTPLMHTTEERDGAVVGGGGEINILRELYEDAAGLCRLGETLDDLVGFSAARAARSIDARVARAVRTMQGNALGMPGVAEVAAGVGLSSSRFQHLFSAQTGVAFRRYRAWIRMRAAIAEIVAGSNFTVSAHAAGFYDQAHFGNDFRRTFGAPPSISLSAIRR